MRMTLTIDDDVLAAARTLAQQQHRTIGDVLSDLARQSLRRTAGESQRNGVPLLPVTNAAAVVTLEMVNAVRDGLPGETPQPAEKGIVVPAREGLRHPTPGNRSASAAD